MSNYQIRADVFPATFTVTAADGSTNTYDKARVIITLDHIYVFQDASPSPKVVFEDRLVSYTPPTPATRVRNAAQLLNRTATLETEDGYTAEFLRAGGCGCGTRLKTTPLNTLLPEFSTTQAASKRDSQNDSV